jgi:hypothetical protein
MKKMLTLLVAGVIATSAFAAEATANDTVAKNASATTTTTTTTKQFTKKKHHMRHGRTKKTASQASN